MIISHKTSGVPFVCYIWSIIIYYQIHQINTSIHIYHNNSTCINTSINKHPLAPDPNNKTQHNHVLITYWTRRNLINHVYNVQCVYILMSWQNFTLKCMSASKVKDDLRCSFEKQIRLQLIPSLSTNIDHACWSLLTKWLLWFIQNFILWNSQLHYFNSEAPIDHKSSFYLKNASDFKGIE